MAPAQKYQLGAVGVTPTQAASPRHIGGDARFM
jgi:hypothetical protein